MSWYEKEKLTWMKDLIAYNSELDAQGQGGVQG